MTLIVDSSGGDKFRSGRKMKGNVPALLRLGMRIASAFVIGCSTSSIFSVFDLAGWRGFRWTYSTSSGGALVMGRGACLAARGLLSDPTDEFDFESRRDFRCSRDTEIYN